MRESIQIKEYQNTLVIQKYPYPGC